MLIAKWRCNYSFLSEKCHFNHLFKFSLIVYLSLLKFIYTLQNFTSNPLFIHCPLIVHCTYQELCALNSFQSHERYIQWSLHNMWWRIPRTHLLVDLYKENRCPAVSALWGKFSHYLSEKHQGWYGEMARCPRVEAAENPEGSFT